MKKTWKRLCTGFLALATVVTALPTTPVHAESKTNKCGRKKGAIFNGTHFKFRASKKILRG